MSGFVPLLSLVATMSPAQHTFLEDVIRRDQNEDGSDKGIVARMQNDTCRKCHEDYKKKYPNKAFKIKCAGIFDEEYAKVKHAELAAQGTDSTLEEVREIYDTPYWAERNIVVKNKDGDYVPFQPYVYQREALACTAQRKVDRWGRGMGKTLAGVAEELHIACTKKKNEIMIVCPQQTQAELWYNEILNQIENSPSLAGILAGNKQAPYYQIRLYNGTFINIFTAGSSSGKKGGSMRGQSPRRIRLDEQDYLSEGDYDALSALFRRSVFESFHGSSTPTGLRGMYWNMCMKNPEYREFYHPITAHPMWNAEMEEGCIREAKTMDRYRHEFLAEFGDPTAGVFKSMFIDSAMKAYQHRQMLYNQANFYVMGIDWNGEGTGTRICVTEYDPITKVRSIVERKAVDEADATTAKSIQAIVQLNKKWNCSHVYIDAGFGFAQDELLRMEGQAAGVKNPTTGAVLDAQTAKLKNLQKIDFGAALEFNKIVPNREPDEKKRKGEEKEDELKRRTKPFMVEGCVMAFEMGLVALSAADDKNLEEQLRGYRVKTWSASGTPASYEPDPEARDHDLDAFMLSMLGIETQYGLLQTREHARALAQILHVGGFGQGSSQMVREPGDPFPFLNQAQTPSPLTARGVTSRSSIASQQTNQSGHAGIQSFVGNRMQTRRGMVPSRSQMLNNILGPGQGNKMSPYSPINPTSGRFGR